MVNDQIIFDIYNIYINISKANSKLLSSFMQTEPSLSTSSLSVYWGAISAKTHIEWRKIISKNWKKYIPLFAFFSLPLLHICLSSLFIFLLPLLFFWQRVQNPLLSLHCNGSGRKINLFGEQFVDQDLNLNFSDN